MLAMSLEVGSNHEPERHHSLHGRYPATMSWSQEALVSVEAEEAWLDSEHSKLLDFEVVHCLLEGEVGALDSVVLAVADTVEAVAAVELVELAAGQ